MTTPYTALTIQEKKYNQEIERESEHGYKIIYASGESHFFDSGNQNNIDTFTPTISTGIFDRTGLVSPFSNLQQARDYSIQNFSIFNPYIHYVPNGGTKFEVDTYKLLNKSIYDFNIYSTAFRSLPTQ
jgi:hypothetical protein